ncbi:uncharacterized protein LOC115440578 isoform X2 [Manduca sexta]|uniref:uncharacterized protein LOC115440578 isoform X2 n=1 Tax=Manduca sexta TaxID=7130 RepID=UPI001182C547|nr:uncharacterized protein LOC115440578 isoform X2 [Manduca sexta]
MYFIIAADEDLSAQKMLNILREVDREDLEILDVETLMKLFEKQMQNRGENLGHQSYLQVIWRKLYETYFIKKDVHRNDKLLAFKQGIALKNSRDGAREGAAEGARDDAVRLRPRAE